MPFKRTLKIGRDISLFQFIRSRIVTPKEIIAGIHNPVYDDKSIGSILFNARYNAGKALEGYDFI